ncbi:hypothetical protein N7488_002450 [Penicillium malachiteum]|nr:hypothetical protein N7488_002450 [Penicillium malachiteum]
MRANYPSTLKKPWDSDAPPVSGVPNNQRHSTLISDSITLSVIKVLYSVEATVKTRNPCGRQYSDFDTLSEL